MSPIQWWGQDEGLNMHLLIFPPETSQCSRERVCHSVTDLQMRAPKKSLWPHDSHQPELSLLVSPLLPRQQELETEVSVSGA